MAKAYSMDLRERVVEAVERDSLSRNQAAARFEVAISTAIDWVNRYRETGSVAPGQIGGHRPKKLVGEHREWLLRRCRERAFTLRGLVRELADRGLSVDYRVVWAFVHEEKLSYKKDADCQRARSSRRGAATSAMDGLSGSHRSGPSGLHRRDLDQDQHGAIARLEPPRSAPAGQGAARPMDDHDLACCPSPRSRRGALADRWPDRWRKLPPLHRPGAHPHPAARRHRHHGQPGLAQEQRHPTRPKGSRRQALLPAEVLAGSEPYRDALLKAQTRLAEGRQAHPHAVYQAIVELLPTVHPIECANYFAKAGYART